MSKIETSISLLQKLPLKLKENLSSVEEVICYLKTFEIVERPNYLILTNIRIIYFDEKHFGRYEFKAIPFQKILQVKAKRGTMMWGDISLKTEDDTIIQLDKVDHDDLKGFMDALEMAYNNIAVEPISIKHDKGMIDKETWEFNKPAEMVFTQKLSNQSEKTRNIEDPINQLKLRFIKGEISEEEYRNKLLILQENE